METISVNIYNSKENLKEVIVNKQLIYDCFLFFNELDLLEIRLNVLNEIVDYFVICESSITHSGETREFCFEQNKERFSSFLDKIIYIKIEEIPDSFYNLEMSDTDNTWNIIVDRINNNCLFDIKTQQVYGREYIQREFIIKALTKCNDNDIIILSDVDEIPNPKTVLKLIPRLKGMRMFCLKQNCYYYYLNLLKETEWVGPRISLYRKFKTMAVNRFRHRREIIISNGGWHFSFQGGLEGVRTKIKSYGHCDQVTEDVLLNLENRINNNMDLFGRNGKLGVVTLDESFPKYILENQSKFKHMIK